MNLTSIALGDARLRAARGEDRSALYQVCLQTGAGGEDATGQFSDPAWLGHRFVGPYLACEPGFAWTLEDALGPCGYVLGTPDSIRFAQRFETEWFPTIAEELAGLTRRFPRVVSSLEAEQRAWFQDRRWEFPEPQDAYPAHLHIDLLPRARGRGWGRVMIRQLLEALRRSGVPGVHLAMHPNNHRARRFYEALGFQRHPHPISETTLYLTQSL